MGGHNIDETENPDHDYNLLIEPDIEDDDPEDEGGPEGTMLQ